MHAFIPSVGQGLRLKLAHAARPADRQLCSCALCCPLSIRQLRLSMSAIPASIKVPQTQCYTVLPAMLEKTPGHPQVRQIGAVFLIYKVWGSQSGWWAPED